MANGGGKSCRVVVFRGLSGLGDTLCAVPALRLLRQSLPQATITYLGVDTVEPVVSRFGHYLDEFVAFPGWPGLPEHSTRFDEDAVRALRGADLVVQMHGDGSISNGFCAHLQPKAFAGHGCAVMPAGCRMSTVPFDRSTNEVLRCLELAERSVVLLNATPVPVISELEFPLTRQEAAEAEACMRRHGLVQRQYAVVHTGSSARDRRWPTARFAEVGRVLQHKGIAPVLTGTSEELEVARATAELIGSGAVVVTGELSLGGTAALIGGSRGVVTNDTGVSHVAAALRVPSVVVFTGSDPQRWAPLDSSRHLVVADSDPDRATGADGEALTQPSVTETIAAVSAAGIA